MLGNCFKTMILMVGIVEADKAGAEFNPPSETGRAMIINRFSVCGLKGLFSAHPQTEQRVYKLMAMVR